MPPKNATRKQRAEYEKRFNDRAKAYRYSPLAGPDHEGYTRWEGPYSAGRAWSRELPETIRNADKGPLVRLPAGSRPKATMTISEKDLPLRQHTIAGTTAHTISMGRRLVAETANSSLKKGRFLGEKGFFQVFGTTKILFLLGFTIAGYNHRRARSFRRSLERFTEKAKAPKRRAKRRTDTYGQIAGLAMKTTPERVPGRGPPST